ncbi:MAG: helix-turn-helix transcriptional regulator [Alphaproteobacteria bacterium]|nr:helix-turn-helix transcriptional regulator [Alphaproteobacteria bacterium]
MPTIAGAAMAAGLSVRSLQRRLAGAGVTYSQLREEVRREAAFRLIEDCSLNLFEIAAALGYSDPAHFTRAFVRWSGTTPRAYRRQVMRASLP